MSQKKRNDKTKVSTRLAPVRLLCGVDLIRLERERQMSQEGWTLEHDDTHRKRELCLAAISYAQAHANPDRWAAERGELPAPTADWPWAAKWWRPGDSIRNLVKAGALIAAEIDRLQRVKTKPHNGQAQRPGSPDAGQT